MDDISTHASHLSDIFESAYKTMYGKSGQSYSAALLEAKKKSRSNPVCSAHGVPRQSHTCKHCAQEDLRLLDTNPNLTPWDKAFIMHLLTRSYFCGVCVLEGHRDFIHHIKKAGHCKQHSHYNKRSICFLHSMRWAACFKCCHEFRAGSLRCPLCGLPYQSRCACPRGRLALRNVIMQLVDQQPEEQLNLKHRIATSIIQHAKNLHQANDTEENVCIALMEHEISNVKNVFELVRENALLNKSV